MSRVIQRLLSFIGLVAPGIAIAYGVILALEKAGLPETDWFKHGTWGQYRWLVDLLGILSAGVAALEAWILAYKRRRDQRLEAMEEALQLLVLNFHEASEIPVNHLPAHLWRVRRGMWSEEHLERLTTFKMDTKVPPSGITWVRGRGAIGRAWEERLPFTVDLAPVRAAFDAGRKVYYARSEVDRLRLTFEEFRLVAHYGSVYVAPLLADGSGILVGVATVGCTMPGMAEKLETASHAPAVDAPVSTLEGLVREL